jgi:aspartyl-tRNA(Asn)/glutamyl-tRNA(Gln) amidotransferase subunit A
MTMATDLCYLSLRDIARRIETRDVSPVEVTQAVLDRIERLNPTLNAYITVMAEQALDDARAAAGDIANGNYRGPLHGVPVGVKDLCQTVGVRTTAGSKILEDWVPDEDSALVRRLRDAGAVIVGKAHLHEWAFGTTGMNPHFGFAHNPWNIDCVTGGSSSGSGVAVAAGLCYAAIGSDTGGSIRIPASLCGVTGIKPTYGRVSLAGTVPLSWSLDHLGPMARSALDCALVLDAIAGHDPADPASADAPVESWAAALESNASGEGEFVPRLGPMDTARRSSTLAGQRVGVVTNALNAAEAETAALVRVAIDALARLGAEVREITLPVLEEYWPVASVVLLSEAAAYHKDNIEARPEDYGDDVRDRIQAGLELKATDYIRGMRSLEEVRKTCDDTFLPGVDVLALPATRQDAVTIESVTQEDPTVGYTRFTAQFNLTGQPALSVPCGLTQQGLPVGLQLVGRRFEEITVLRAAHALESEAKLRLPFPPISE